MWWRSNYTWIVALWVIAGILVGAEAGLALLPFIAWAFATLFALDAVVHLLRRTVVVSADGGQADAASNGARPQPTVLSFPEPAAMPGEQRPVLFSASGSVVFLTAVRREDGGLYLQIDRQG